MSWSHTPTHIHCHCAPVFCFSFCLWLGDYSLPLSLSLSLSLWERNGKREYELDMWGNWMGLSLSLVKEIGRQLPQLPDKTLPQHFFGLWLPTLHLYLHLSSWLLVFQSIRKQEPYKIRKTLKRIVNVNIVVKWGRDLWLYRWQLAFSFVYCRSSSTTSFKCLLKPKRR